MTALNLVVMCGVVYFGCVGSMVSHFRVHVGRLSASVLWPVTLKKYPSAAGAYPPVLSSLGRNTIEHYAAYFVLCGYEYGVRVGGDLFEESR